MKGQMWPIQGASKAKRILWGAAQNEISWAYMKMLREGSRSMKVYDINPYVEVYRFYDNLYGLFNQNCDGAGDVWMWLVIGPRKALLIDTAYGLGDLKGLVNTITGGMPLTVVNTHIGPDHVLGNCRFERVYCHEYDFDAIKDKCKPGAWDYLFDKDGKNIWLQFDRKDLPVYKNYELVAVKDGHTFNLGGDYDVELVWTAGHSPGHSMYLDKKRRYLFAGDDVCSDVTGCGSGPGQGRPNGQYANLSTYRDCLTKLVARIGEYDYLFPGHFMVNLENSVLVHLLDTLNEIIAKPDGYDYKVVQQGGTGGPGRERMFKFVKGFSTVGYTQTGVFPPKS
jgi:glyoxylase-like metal-dependent hydrolase (beta-lactamase superfamily II)